MRFEPLRHVPYSFPMYGVDYAWLAVDACGHLAIFTTVGQGPIPVAAIDDGEDAFLALQRAEESRAEKLVRELPELSSYEMLYTFPRPDDFVAWGRRGLFAYDWRDVDRTVPHTEQYELVTRPTVPMTVDAVGIEVSELANRVQLDRLRFAETKAIAVPMYVRCYQR